MRETIFILLFILVSGTAYPQEKNIIKNHSATEQYDRDDEYQHIQLPIEYDNDEENTLEYEQMICDAVKPSKPSTIVAFFTSIGCTMLVHYITFTEKAKVMLASLKHTVAKWLCAHA